MENNRETIVLPYCGPIFALDISPDGQMLAVGQQSDFSTSHPLLTLWNLPQKQLIAELEHMVENSIDAVCFSGDSKLLYYAKNDADYAKVLVYNIELKQHIVPQQLEAVKVTWLAHAKQAPRLVTAGLLTEIWDTETEERKLQILDYMTFNRENGKPAVADLTDDGKTVAVVGKNIDRVHIYEVETGAIVQTLDGAPRQAQWISYSPDERYLAVIDDFRGHFYLWELESGNKISLNGLILGGYELDSFFSLSFHPSSKYLALGEWTGDVIIIQLSNGEEIASETLHTGRVYGLAFTPDGKQLISGDEGGTISIWNLEELLQF
jgi:WD40 repeat protein